MVFLDVGAHEGQTLEEVTKPGYGFETIFAFEPMPAQYQILEDRYGGHVTILNYGLSDQSGIFPLYGSNDGMEASVFPTKRDVDETVVTECRLVRATEFFESLPAGVPLFVKLNCEGSEIPIMRDLALSGEIHRVTELMIDFDIRKVIGREHEEAEVIALLDEIGFGGYSLCEDVMVGVTHQERIRHWLAPKVGGSCA